MGRLTIWKWLFFLGDGPLSLDDSTPIVSPVGDTDEDSRDGMLNLLS